MRMSDVPEKSGPRPDRGMRDQRGGGRAHAAMRSNAKGDAGGGALAEALRQAQQRRDGR